MHVIEHSTWYANSKHGEFPYCLVLYAARHINNHALMEFNFFIVQDHPSLAFYHVIELIRSFVIVEFSVLNLNVMNFSSSIV